LLFDCILGETFLQEFRQIDISNFLSPGQINQTVLTFLLKKLKQTTLIDATYVNK
jgi:hypothetical protein